MRQLSRRDFLIVTGGGIAATAVAAACGGDDDADPTSTRVAGETPQPTAAEPTPGVTVGADNGAGALRWYGQAMFLLTSPGGTNILLDPFSDIGYTLPPPVEASTGARNPPATPVTASERAS